MSEVMIKCKTFYTTKVTSDQHNQSKSMKNIAVYKKVGEMTRGSGNEERIIDHEHSHCTFLKSHSKLKNYSCTFYERCSIGEMLSLWRNS
jgi:hypothetical protein